ncbi:MAG: Asp-tRNA(Asn)/Glu-tRNA(Gln) amidotransferase GatCAB subunit B, partial [Roseiarcus sp.]
SAYDAGVLVSERETADYYESAVSYGGATRDAKAVANWIMGDLSAFANTQGLSVAQTRIPAASIATLVDLIGEGVISGKIAKDVLAIIIAEDRSADPRSIVETRGLKQVTDSGAIESAVDAIIAANPDKVAQAIAKPTLLGWFVGQVMKSTGGKANPQAVNDMLKDKLGLR